MGACVSRRGDRAECRRCARLPAPSSASPFADAVADAALVRVPSGETKRRASFALERSRGVSPLTASALARKALEEGDPREASDSDEDWRSAQSAQTTRSSVDATELPDTAETAGTHEAVSETPRRDVSSPADARERDRSPFDVFDVRERRTVRRRVGARARALPRAGPVADGTETRPSAETDAAFAALARAAADFEDDATLVSGASGANGANGATTRTRPTSVGTPARARSRLAKLSEGARMVSAVRAALRRAGGVLDLTAFKGTPIKWHAPHSALLAHARGESTLKRPRALGETARATRARFARDRSRGSRVSGSAGTEDSSGRAEDVDGVVVSKNWLARRPPRAARLFTSLWHSFVVARNEHRGIDGGIDGGAGAETSRTPRAEEARLPPEHRRMLAVVSAVLADCEPPALFKKPFNPVLGETARHELEFIGGGSVTSVLEQVSHHPPITAFHSTFRDEAIGAKDGFAAFGHFRPRPSLRGFPFAGKVRVDIEGTRTFRVPVEATSGGRGGRDGRERDDAGAFEDYVTNYVGFEWLFFPAPRARTRAGETHVVRCDATGLVAEIEHGGSRGTAVVGTVFSTREASSSANDRRTRRETPLYALRGDVDSRVVAARVNPDANRETFVVYDAETAAVREASGVGHDVAFDLDPTIDPRGSHAVWRGVARAMRAEPSPAWDAARRAKSRVEADERVARSARSVAFEPRFFERDEPRDTWVLRADIAARGAEPRRAPREGER